MKKMLIMASAIMMAAAANAQRVVTESFNKVMVNVPARVSVVPGDTYSVNVVTTDSVMAKSLQINVDNGVLSIAVNPWGLDSESNSVLRLIIVTPVEPKVLAGRDCNIKTVCNTYPEDKKDIAANN